MPLTSNLDSLEYAVNLARVRLNDAIQALPGDVVTDDAAFTLVAINGGWRQLQELLVNFKYTWLTVESIIPNIPAVASADPGSQESISSSSFFNGTNTFFLPVLPANLIAPLRCWERVTGSNGAFMDMDRFDNGLSAVPKIGRNKSWEWRNGAIWVPGATQVMDLRVRYAASSPDFLDPSTTPFSGQLVPIARASNALAWFICAEIAKPRGDLDAGDFEQKGQLAAKFLFDLDPLQAKSIDKESEYGKMRDANTPNEGPSGPRGKG